VVEAAPAAVMLTPGICKAFAHGVRPWRRTKASTVARGLEGGQPHRPRGPVQRPAADFLANPHLHEEVFGAASVVVRCADLAELPR
jgi:alpha-ketoglutaric semialdehyde dehydrogenase